MKDRARRDLHAIVLGGHVTALGVVRALAGVVSHCEVWDRTPCCIARMSRYVDNFRQVEIQCAATLVERLLEHASERHLTFVFPTEDLSTGILSQNYDRLTQHGLVPVADRWEAVQKFYFKEQTYRLAADIGIPHPRSMLVEEFVQRHDALQYPLILKPTIMEPFNQKFHKKAVVCSSKAELMTEVERLQTANDDYRLLAQEIIPGSSRHLYSFGMIRLTGQLLGGIAVRRKRQYPAHYGTGTFVETCAIPQLQEYSLKLTEAVDYNGVCEVEFKFDERDGKLKLLEVNPRLWKWHALSLEVGINFAALFVATVLGEKVESRIVTACDMHVAWRDAFSDVVSISQELAAGNTTVAELLAEVAMRKRDSVFWAADPRPFLYLVWLLPWLARGGRRAL